MSTAAVEDKNPRGIPRAPFIADVEAYLGGPEVDVEVPLRGLQDALSKYRFMESNLKQRRQSLEEKIPDIRKTLKMVEYLREKREGKSKASSEEEEAGLSKEPPKTTFELNDTLFAEAELEETDEVYLWLGANVMLSYKFPAAIELLQSKLAAAETSLKNTIEDFDFLREQLTVLEVNIARVHNWDVKRKRERRDRESASSKGDSG